MNKNILISTLPVLLLGFLLFSNFNNIKSIAVENGKYDVLNDSLKSWVKKNKIIGVELLVIENNRKVIHQTYGWSDKEKGKELETGAVWAGLSISKPFTATAILMLMEEGLLSLDDPITKYIPKFKGNQEITIHHLLSQSSGDDGKHGNGGHNVLDFETLDEWVDDWAKQESSGTFGEFAYSNFNYGALAYIVEIISGNSIEAFIENRIIKPLKLKNTYVAFAPDSAWAGKVPSRYQWNEIHEKFDKHWTNKEPQTWKFYTGALGLWLSAEDYATFIQVWINKGKYGDFQLLKKSTVEEAVKMKVNAYGEPLFGHGYGWFIEEEPLVFNYGGSAGGFGIGYPDKNITLIYFTHSAGGNHKNNFRDELDKIWFAKDK